jgi:hypothetical protein
MARRLVTRDFGQQMLFTGTNGVTVPYTPSTTSFSVAFWANVRVNAAGGRFIDWQDTGPALGFRIQQLATNDIQISIPGSTTLTFNYGSKSQWFHLVLTYSFSGTSSVKCYLNGVLTSSTSGGTQITASSTTLRIGNRSTGGGANPAESLMDNTYFFDKELTQTEINNLYYDGSIPSELRCGIQFNNNLTDISGNGFNGTLIGGTYVTEPPLRTRTTVTRTAITQPRVATRDMGTALSFDGVDDYVDIGSTIDETLAASGQFTIATFIKPAISNVFQSVISLGGGGVGKIELNIRANGNFGARLTDGANAEATFDFNSSGLVSRHVYQNVALTYSNDLAIGYKNGLAAGTKAYTGLTVASGLNRIGVRPSTNDDFRGLLDKVRIWNRALTATEIANMYYNNIVPRNGLVAEYLFNETTGTTALDSSGNGNNGTITGATYTDDVPYRERTLV